MTKNMYKTAVENELPNELKISLVKISDLRYGENPNQPAAIYAVDSVGEFSGMQNVFSDSLKLIKDGKNGLSATNYMDIFKATEIIKYFEKKDISAVSVMKHLNPSGFAVKTSDRSIENTFDLAWNVDSRSAFGSVVVINDVIDKATAEAMTSDKFIEVVVAKDFEEGVMSYYNKKENLRVVKLNDIKSLTAYSEESAQAQPFRDIKSIGMNKNLVQERFLTKIRGYDDLELNASKISKKDGNEYVVNTIPSEKQIFDLMTAWYVAVGVRSNAVVMVKDGVTVSIGTGQQERVGAVEQAITKGYQKAMDRAKIKYDSLMGIRGGKKLKPFKDAVCASDGFIPFSDSVDLLARVGISGIIQPGGSDKDISVIKAVNKYKMSMIFTGERCFSH